MLPLALELVENALTQPASFQLCPQSAERLALALGVGARVLTIAVWVAWLFNVRVRKEKRAKEIKLRGKNRETGRFGI